MSWLRTNLYAILLAAKAALLALAYAKGRSDANATQDTKRMEDYHDTRKRIDQIARDGDVELQREFLRERGRK
jgi:hypothetical protein